MKQITDYLNFLGQDTVEWVNDFLKSDIEDKRCMIAGLFGISDSSIKKNVFTYYYWISNVCIGNIFNYSGESRNRKWRKLIKCRKVEYNYITDEMKITELKRFNKRATENAGRSL